MRSPGINPHIEGFNAICRGAKPKCFEPGRRDYVLAARDAGRQVR